MPRVKGDSKDAILDAAFLLFSEKGYTATSVRDIASAIDIKAASLYNHFKGKREIFDALIKREIEYVEESLHAEGAMAEPSDDPAAYAELSGHDIQELVWKSYMPFFESERIMRLRHMLAMSRYDDKRCAKLYVQIFIERPVLLQGSIFAHLVEIGQFEPCDAHLAATEFHGPMHMLMDAEASAKEAERFCKAHVKSFNEAHMKEENE